MRSKFRHPEMKFIRKTAMPIHWSLPMCGSCGDPAVDTSRVRRDREACAAENIYYLAPENVYLVPEKFANPWPKR